MGEVEFGMRGSRVADWCFDQHTVVLDPAQQPGERPMRAGVVLVFDGLDERPPAGRLVERGSETLHHRAGAVGGHAVGDAPAQRAAKMPLADPNVRQDAVLVGEGVGHAQTFALSMSLITTRGTPRSARQKRSNAAASLTGLASSRQTRSGPGGRPSSAGSRPTAPIT
jgi:hypothetical protein